MPAGPVPDGRLCGAHVVGEDQGASRRGCAEKQNHKFRNLSAMPCAGEDTFSPKHYETRDTLTAARRDTSVLCLPVTPPLPSHSPSTHRCDRKSTCG
eukprot:scaffold27055_cov133-Isochrysis_galbana.AAC.1